MYNADGGEKRKEKKKKRRTKKKAKKTKKENGGWRGALALALGKRKKSIYAYVYRKYPSYLNIVCVEEDL